MKTALNKKSSAQQLLNNKIIVYRRALARPKSKEWCGRRDLNPGYRLGRPAGDWTPTVSTNISWAEARKNFIEYLKVQEYDERTIKDAVSYLDKYATVIRQPQDVIALFAKVRAGKRHVVLGLRLLFNFYEALGN